ncbi:hypothetical protein TNCT_524461 [Trichonephila clavata]|uniref:Uncharacterized protein n=1 Tax=Trichonephila clavata TaxID=2740835 RepID=A0A8X6IBG7_TRICU|nr:hypothetical protein TNCT_524461 [Trichonephila clavata]
MQTQRVILETIRFKLRTKEVSPTVPGRRCPSEVLEFRIFTSGIGTEKRIVKSGDVCNGLYQESGIRMDMQERFFGVASKNSSAAASIVKEVRDHSLRIRKRG